MTDAPIRVEATGRDLRVIAKKLRAMDDKAVAKRFRTELRAAAAPMLPAVRNAIKAIPAKGPRSTGLRKRLARAATLRVATQGRKAQVSLFMSTYKMPDHQKSLPAMMEGLKPWRHPFFGDTDKWVQQQAHPYFAPTLRILGPASKAAVQKIVRDIERETT